MIASIILRAAVVLLSLGLLSGCASRRPTQLGPFMKPGDPAVDLGGELPQAPRRMVEDYEGSVRRVGSRVGPNQTNGSTMSAEAWDPGLASALLDAVAAPSAITFRRVADVYHRLGVLDAAYDYLTRAIDLDLTDAAAYDARARISRDSRVPHLGLDDARLAIFYAPRSPEPHNTHGTLLLALGRLREARRAFERALALDSKAVYALNNLCYVARIERDTSRAVKACTAALEIDPSSRQTRNNLALAHALAGDLNRAEAEFARAGDAGSSRYNTGVMYMMSRQYVRAATEFEAAVQARPSLGKARVRARQAYELARGVSKQEQTYR